MGERAFEWVSKEDYFSLVEKSDIKYEYWDGYIVDMSGGSPAHAAITAYTGVAIGSRLLAQGSKCTLSSSDLLIQTSEVRNYFYPDLSVYCGPADFKGDALANPVLIVEVLSPSTQRRDLGYKLRHYKSIPSVQHVLFIQQDSLVALLHTRRAEDDWDVRIYVAAEQVIELTAIGISVTLGELYGPLLNQAPYNESPDPPERTR